MRAGCVWIEHFPLGVEAREWPGIGGMAVVVGGQPWEKREVLDCSPEVEGAGVGAGLGLAFLDLRGMARSKGEEVELACGMGRTIEKETGFRPRSPPM